MLITLLFKYVNSYYEALEKNQNKHALLKALDDVVEYTFFHFKDEEKMMGKYSFLGSTTHKLIHRQLEKDVTALREWLEKGEDVASEIKLFLKS